MTAGQIFLAVARNVVRAVCVALIGIGLIALFMPFHARFLTDNAVGASANAAEQLAQTVRASVFIAVGLGFFVLFKAPKEKSE